MDRRTKSLETESLISLVCQGRNTVFEAHARALIHAFASALGSTAEFEPAHGFTLMFTLSRLDLAFRGFGGDHVYCVLVAGDGYEWARVESLLWQRVERNTEMPLILACNQHLAELAQQKVRGHLALVLNPAAIIEVISCDRSLEGLKCQIRNKYKPGELHPFDHQRPVEDALFLGRNAILHTLRNNPNTNFALVGPSKIGKTSFVKRYLRASRLERAMSGCQVYVDLFDKPVNDLALARAVRMAINPGAAAYKEPADSLPEFIAKTRSRLRGPLEIVLDETDRHLVLPSMRVLIHQGIKKMCRIVLVGRWQLMKFAIHTVDDNFNRLEPVVMPPLTFGEAQDLIERPLRDLGFNIQECRQEFRLAVNRLGRVPGLIQELGAFTVAEAERSSLPEAIHLALGKIISVSRLIGLLNDLSSIQARIAALLLLLYGKKDEFAEPLWLRDQFRHQGIRVGIAQCIELCDELVIHHLLGYENGTYKLALWDIVTETQQQRDRLVAMLEEDLDIARSGSFHP